MRRESTHQARQRGPVHERTVLVNGAFRGQRVTGQQRYASEIAERLITAGAREIVPGRFWARSAVRTWLWTLVVMPIAARRAVLVSLTARAPIWHPRHVVAVHDLFPLTNPEWYTRRYIWTHVPLLRLHLRWSAAMVAVSEPVAEQVATETTGPPIAVAPNAPSEIFLQADGRSSAFDRLGLRPDRFLLAIGSLDPRKNLPRLAGAWSLVPESERLSCPLVIVGGGDAIYRQGDIDWPTGMVAAGYVSDAELVSLYESARGVVFVSLAEGFGLPIVEAAAAGVTRFVLSDIEVFHWIAGDAAVYVDPLSQPQMAEALRSVIDEQVWSGSRIDMRRFAWEQSASTVMAAARRVARS